MKRLLLLGAIFLLTGCDDPYVAFQRSPCAGKWATVRFEVRADTAIVVAVCRADE